MPSVFRILPVLISVCIFLYPAQGISRAGDMGPDREYDTVSVSFIPEDDLFESEESISISLEFNIKKFFREKYREEFHYALLKYSNRKGAETEKTIRIQSRGDFRKTHCSFPPIKLNFKKTEFDETSLNEIGTLKLVTHCKPGKEYQQYLIKEYLVYRMFNIMTDFSYRVRLLDITYIDSKGKMKPVLRHGFIIESNKHLADRLDAVRIEKQQIPTWNTQPEQTNLMTMFQYMIGNTDWAILNQHNIRLFKTFDPLYEKPLAIPYDFDYAGMVNTYYAVPDENLDIPSVRERVYRGYCLDSDGEYERIFRTFMEHREALYSLVGDCTLLNDKHRHEMYEYLDEFFKIIEDPGLTRRSIIQQCRSIPRR
jgi:hypothetical protein